MYNLLTNLFGIRKQRPMATKRKEHHRIHPTVESLENRDLMAAYISGGNLMVTGTSANDAATVSDYSTTKYRVNLNGTNYDFLKSQVTTGKVYFYGYAGNDTFYNNVFSGLRSYAYGGAGNDIFSCYNNSADVLDGQDGDDTLYSYAGNDILYGGNGNDKLYAGAGNDNLYGGAGNDKLYGDIGTDALYGQDGNDFMDAGTAGETAVGGNGYDFNAFIFAVSGATANDVYQGDGSQTCWLVSSISSVARTGVDLASRISYVGNNSYRVYMYNTSNVWSPVYVTFNGDTYAGGDAKANPNLNQEGESWVLLTQRAYLQSRGLSLTTPPSGWADAPLQALTGRTSNTYWNPSGGVGGTDYTRIADALRAGKNVVADTRDNTANLTTTVLISWHQYTVGAVLDSGVLLRNPWGRDGGVGDDGVGNDPFDGLIFISWSDFCGSMDAYIIN